MESNKMESNNLEDICTSLIPRPCTFIGCSTNFVLQATNEQGLGTRLGLPTIFDLFQCVKMEGRPGIICHVSDVNAYLK